MGGELLEKLAEFLFEGELEERRLEAGVVAPRVFFV
jgi:hypothetical protein